MPPPPASSQGVPLPLPVPTPRPPRPDMNSPVALRSAIPVLLPTLLPQGPPTPPFAPRVSQQSRPSPGRQTLFATPSQRNSMAVLQRDYSRRPSLLAQSPSQLQSPPSLRHQRRMSLSADADTLLQLMGPPQPFETSSLQRATSADGEQNGGRGNSSSKGDGGVSAIDLVRHRAAMVQLSALQAPHSGRDGAKVAAASAAGSALRAAAAAGSAAACALESAVAAWRARAAGAAAGAARIARQAAANAVARAERATTCAQAAATNAAHAARAAARAPARAAALAARVAVAASASCRLVAERAVLVARHSVELRTAALSIQCSVRGWQAKAAASVRRGVRGTYGAAAAAAAASSAAWAAAMAAEDANATAARAISSADAAWRTHEEAYAYFDPTGYC
jgi:hypothetical protein